MSKLRDRKRVIKVGKRSVLARNVLEVLSDVALDSASLFLSIATSPYGSSQWQLEKNKEKIRESLENHGGISKDEELKRARHSFHSLMTRLRSDGLIEEKEGKFKSTLLGRKKLESMTSDAPSVVYENLEKTNLKIFMFDVPEKDRWQRDWLRKRLFDLEFEPVQKSVFVGRTKLPKEFIEDMRDVGILAHIDVLEVTKRGSLKEII